MPHHLRGTAVAAPACRAGAESAPPPDGRSWKAACENKISDCIVCTPVTRNRQQSHRECFRQSQILFATCTTISQSGVLMWENVDLNSANHGEFEVNVLAASVSNSRRHARPPDFRAGRSLPCPPRSPPPLRRDQSAAHLARPTGCPSTPADREGRSSAPATVAGGAHDCPGAGGAGESCVDVPNGPS